MSKFVIPGVIESKTCLLPMITPQSYFLLRMFRHYEGRLLPYSGGLLDQPNYYLEAMELISTTVNQLIAHDAKQNRTDRGR